MRRSFARPRSGTDARILKPAKLSFIERRVEYQRQIDVARQAGLPEPVDPIQREADRLVEVAGEVERGEDWSRRTGNSIYGSIQRVFDRLSMRGRHCTL